MTKIFLAMATILLLSCGGKKNVPADSSTDTVMVSAKMKPRINGNAIYYWKTTFDLNESELNFLKEHEVIRLYLRYFDVAMDNGWLGDDLSIVPIATTVFKCHPPEGMEIVPTIYITLDALRAMKGEETQYADKIITRVLAMTKRHNIQNVNEVQLDCDWTKNTENSFFRLCEIARDTLHNRGIALSSTIRLHQLSGKFPPADRGVLMLYNTGALQSIDTNNSILDYDDVAQYVKADTQVENLDFAYPTFAWGVWFRKDKFMAIIRKTDLSDKTLYKPQRNGSYKVIKDHYLESHEILVGDIIRLENSDYDEIAKVKKLMNKHIGEYSSILYHLDSTNLSKYTSDEIRNIYRAN